MRINAPTAGSMRRTLPSQVLCCGGINYPRPDPYNCDPFIPTESKPWITSTTGELDPVINNPFNSFSISKPNCCTLTVITDCGTITIPSNMSDWSSCDFFTDVQFNSISLELDPEDDPSCIDDITLYMSGILVIELDPPDPCPPVVPMPKPDPTVNDPCGCLEE